ncbi:MAG TPA: pyridoxamine 5'-phosphate oxidase family protein, partial [Mycobacterium sp.]|nr:pyridoxamine 5'-phosphate oxidase family protein [Mycobacterium sp.]
MSSTSAEPTATTAMDAAAVIDAARRVLTDVQLGFLTTSGTTGPSVRMVGHLSVDERLRVVFGTARSTRKVAELRADPAVVYAVGDDRSAACLYGTATLDEDVDHRRAAWGPDLARYFSGPEDAEFVLVVIDPDRVEVWSEPERIYTGPNGLTVAVATRSGDKWAG